MAEKTETPAADAPAAEAAPTKKKGKGKLLIILGVVFLLLSGGGAAAYFTLLKPVPAEGEAAAAAADDAHKIPEAHGLVSFEPFIVNLADTGGRRFLRINVRLLVPEEEEAKEIEEHKVTLERLRASILELLSSQTSEQIASLEGKTALKHQIAEHAKPILEPIEVADVLFSDFVVQY